MRRARIIRLAFAFGLSARANASVRLRSTNHLPNPYGSLAQPSLVWTHVAADVVIAATYILIFSCFFIFGNRLLRLPETRKYSWLSFSVGTFIITCGMMHMMEILTGGQPLHPLATALKVLCAAASFPTALFLAFKAPKLLAGTEGFVASLANAAGSRAQIEAIDRSQMVIEIAMDGNIRKVNENYTRSFGYAASEVEGKPFSLVVSPEERNNGLFETFWEALRAGQFQTGQYKRVTKSGEPIWIEASYNPILDAAGVPVSVVGLLSDVSARVRMEAERARQESALRKSEEFLRETGSLAGVGGWEIDLATDKVAWMPETYQLLGAETSYQPTLQSMLLQYSNESRPLLTAAIDKARVDGTGWDLEVSLFRFDARFMWARVVGKAEWVEGKPVRLLGAFQDITERVTERLALQRANQRAELATESGGIGIWDWDLDKNTLVCDLQMYRIVHLEPDVNRETEFALWSQFIHPDDLPRVEREMADAIHGVKRYDTEFRILLEDGPHFIKATGQVSRDAAGRAVRMVGTNVDVTARVTERRALEQANVRIKLATESGGIGIWEWDVLKGTLECDERTCRLWDMKRELGVGGSLSVWVNRIHAEDRYRFRTALQDAVDSGRSYDVEYRIVWNDGAIRWIKSLWTVERDRDEQAVRMLGTNFDITTRVMEKIALEQANHRVTLATESGGIGIWEWDVPNDMLICDVRMFRLFGLEPEPGTPREFGYWERRVHPDDRLPLQRALQDGLEDVRPFDLEFRVVWDDGSIHWIKASGQVSRDSAGKPLRMVGTNFDITRRVLEKLELEQANARVALATESGGIGIWEWDIVNDRVILDPWIVRLYHLETDEPIPFATWMQKLHPEDRAAAEHGVRASLDGKQTFEADFRIVPKDGVVKHVQAAARIVRDPHGRPIKMFGTNLEITQRKLAEEALRDQANLLDLSHDSIMVRDLDGTIRFWNHGAEDMYGYLQHDALGVLSHTLLKTVFPRPIEEIQQVFLEGERWEGELEHVTRSGAHIFTASRWVLQRDRAGRPRGVMEINNDITESKRAQAATQQALIAAELANRAKSDFLANMSHEVRTPVNAIMGMAHLALRAHPTAQQQGYLTKIDTAAKRLLAVMNDILDFSKIEAGKLSLEQIPFSLDEVIRNLRDIVEQKAAQKRLDLLFSTSPQVPASLRGDPLRLGQVLINLVNNAIKFTDHGKISVRIDVVETLGASQPDGQPMGNNEAREPSVTLHVSVTDTGIGMTPSQMENLFQAFHQADTSFTRQYGGTGLGLAISKQLVELMNGNIEITSQFGTGSTFSFTASFGVPAEGPSTPARLPQTTLEKKVLVVDDSDSTRDGLVQLLAAQGYTAKGASSGEEALTLLASATSDRLPFDLVVMDWRLPGINGTETARRILIDPALAPKPAVLLISAYERHILMEEARGVVIDGFLVKPFEETTLLAAVASALAKAAASPALPPPSIDTNLLQGRHVLLVEDNELNRDLATELLGDLGIRVTIAVNGRDAVDLIKVQPFDLVLMDIQMPIMDGLSATKLIRLDDRFRNLPILAMTAHAMSGDRERSLAAGMDDHINKPIDPEGLTRTLVRWLSPRSSAPDDRAKASPGAEPDQRILPDQLLPFNLRAALVRTNGKPMLLRKLLIGFRRQYENVVEEFQNELNRGCPQDAERLVHSLKSIAGMLEAQELAAAAAALEDAMRHGQRDRLPASIDALDAALRPAIAAAATLDGDPQ